MMRFWKRAGRVIFVLVFFFCITFPALLSDKTGGGLSPEENRYLAEAPTLFQGCRLNWQGGALLQEVESWINDNAWGREAARSLLTDVHVQLLGDRMDGQMLLSGDWRFLWRDDLPARAQHLDVLSEEALMAQRQKAQEIQQALADREASFCATIFPHKIEICNPFLPAEINIADQPSLSERLYENLKDTLRLASGYETLQASMEAWQEGAGPLTYYQAFDGSHWNWRGAFLGYGVMMENIQSLYPELYVLQEEDFQVISNQVTTSLPGKSVSEEDSVWTPLQEKQSRREDVLLQQLNLPLKDPWHSNRSYVNEAHPEYPRAVLVGDSYLWMFFLDEIAESFSELVYLNVEDADLLMDVVDQFQPELVAYAGIQLGNFIHLVNVPE
ncbi:MAG: hypothetical protein IJ153_07695 [Clostridia bacterium]|nr:hypothetical protein [Clostridia bacterium]